MTTMTISTISSASASRRRHGMALGVGSALIEPTWQHVGRTREDRPVRGVCVVHQGGDRDERGVVARVEVRLAFARPPAVQRALSPHEEALGLPRSVRAPLAKALEAVQKLAGEIGIVDLHRVLELLAKVARHLGREERRRQRALVEIVQRVDHMRERIRQVVLVLFAERLALWVEPAKRVADLPKDVKEARAKPNAHAAAVEAPHQRLEPHVEFAHGHRRPLALWALGGARGRLCAAHARLAQIGRGLAKLGVVLEKIDGTVIRGLFEELLSQHRFAQSEAFERIQSLHHVEQLRRRYARRQLHNLGGARSPLGCESQGDLQCVTLLWRCSCLGCGHVEWQQHVRAVLGRKRLITKERLAHGQQKIETLDDGSSLQLWPWHLIVRTAATAAGLAFGGLLGALQYAFEAH